VRRGYLNPDNVLRASVVADPQFERKNTKDNTPAVVHVELVPGNTVDVTWRPRAAARRTRASS
jgi:fumarate hydratase class I